MGTYTRFINDKRWEALKTLLTDPNPNLKGGRQPVINRDVREGILWILRTGAR